MSCSKPTKEGYTITAEAPETMNPGQFQTGTEGSYLLRGITCDRDEGYSGDPLAYCETEGEPYGLTGCFSPGAGTGAATGTGTVTGTGTGTGSEPRCVFKEKGADGTRASAPPTDGNPLTRENCTDPYAWSCTDKDDCETSDDCQEGICVTVERDWTDKFFDLFRRDAGFTVNSFTNNTNTIHQKGHVLLLLFAILMYFMLRK